MTRNHSVFDILLCANAGPSATCVIMVNAVCKVTDTINDYTIRSSFPVCIFLFSGSYY